MSEERNQQISHILEDGEIVMLDDHSAWRVYPGFKDVAEHWLKKEMIIVKQGKDPDYPYKLVNVHRNESVEAKEQDPAEIPSLSRP